MRFSGYRFGEPRSAILIERAILVVIVVLAPFFISSSYRAYVQIKGLDLHAPDSVLEPGASIRADVVSWGRTWVQLRIELIQGQRAETLAIKEVPRNRDPVFDPRPRRDSLIMLLSAEHVERFEEGPALVRATARGSMQWLREPPPRVRERRVVIRHGSW